jgi:hypothetical protein
MLKRRRRAMKQDNEQQAKIRAQLNELSRVLRHLHKVLIDAETKRFGTVGNAFEHLQLVTNHPRFAWLHQLSGLMIELDERLDDDEPVDDTLARIYKTALEQLIGPGTNSQPDFRRRYMALLHDAPEITIAHGDLRRLLGELPGTESGAGTSA